jgi:protein gp37
MAETSSIEWTDATWNPITGCSVVSPGCTNCYAMKLAGGRLQHHPSRAGLTVASKAGPVWNGQVRLNRDWLDQPLRWGRPRRIFVCAHGDLFHEDVPDAWIDQVFARMALSPQHTFQVLTKRAARMRAYVAGAFDRIVIAMMQLVEQGWPIVRDTMEAFGLPWRQPASADDWWPLSNVWLGVSAEDQARADERIPELLATPAAVRFLSAEPLLGPIDLRTWIGNVHHHPDNDVAAAAVQAVVRAAKAKMGFVGLDQVILGGESGRGARPMHPDWARQVRDDCAAASVPFFFKQWGAFSEFEAGEPNRVVEVGSDEADAILEFLPGRAAWVHADGRVWHRADDLPEETPARLMVNVGKKAAGRLLDGRTHDGMPSDE